MGLKPRKKPEPQPDARPDFLAACSFCGSHGILVIGPRVSICDLCIEIGRDYVGYVRELHRHPTEKTTATASVTRAPSASTPRNVV